MVGAWDGGGEGDGSGLVGYFYQAADQWVMSQWP